MGPGDGFESFDAREFALEGPVMVEAGAMHDLHRAENAEVIAGEPDLAVSAGGDGAKQFVLGDYDWAQDLGLSGWAAGTHAWLPARVDTEGPNVEPLFELEQSLL